MTAVGQDRPYRDEDWLREKYVGKNMTTHEVADLAGVSHNCIWEWLKKFDIERKRATHRKEKPANFYTSKPQPDGGGGYERWDTTHHSVKVHRLLAVSEFGVEAVAGKVVHHRDHIPWDNRPANIELMDAAEHSKHHRTAESGDIEQTIR